MIRLVLVAWLALCGVANAQLSGGLQFPGPGLPVAAAGYVGPLDVTGYTGALDYWGLRCSTSAYTGNVADVWDSATGITTRTLLTCSSGGMVNETINPLATTCASGCKVKTLYNQVSARPDMTNSIFGATPNLILTGVGFSKPVMRCVTASTLSLYTTTNATTSAQPFTVSMVIRNPTFSADGRHYSNGSAIQIAHDASASMWLYAGGAGGDSAGVPDTQWGAVQEVFNGASSTINSSNAGTNPSATPTTVAANPGTNGLGNSSDQTICARGPNGGSLFYDGYVFEVMTIPGAVSSGNQATMAANQRAYGGF